MKNFVLLAAFVILVLPGYSQDEFTLVRRGDPAPDFEIKDINEKIIRLSDLKGKVVLINFFATWCPPCRQELPHLQNDIYLKYKDRSDFKLLILAREQTWATIDSFRTANNYLMPFYPDPGRKIFALYGTQNIPRNFLIDKEGKIVHSSVGYNEDDFGKLKKELENLMN